MQLHSSHPQLLDIAVPRYFRSSGLLWNDTHGNPSQEMCSGMISHLWALESTKPQGGLCWPHRAQLFPFTSGAERWLWLLDTVV